MILPFLSVCLIIAGFITGRAVFAEDEDRERGNRHEEREREERGSRKGGGYVVPENAKYTQECSSCHFLYIPAFLPSRSWEAIVNGSNKHFGDDLGLDDAAKKEIIAFLTANSAEHANFEWSGKILKSIGSATPERITETPYMKKEHRKIKKSVFERPTVGSPSNCGACHPQGAQGNFDEDAVKIPK